MTSRMDVINAVSAFVMEQMPEIVDNHINFLPRDFKRPAMYIQPEVRQYRRTGKTTVLITDHYTMVLFAAVDGYGESDLEEMLRLQDKALALFAAGYIKVGDRALSVKATDAGTDANSVSIDLQLQFYDYRGIQEESKPPMENVSMRTQIEE